MAAATVADGPLSHLNAVVVPHSHSVLSVGAGPVSQPVSLLLLLRLNFKFSQSVREGFKKKITFIHIL